MSKKRNKRGGRRASRARRIQLKAHASQHHPLDPTETGEAKSETLFTHKDILPFVVSVAAFVVSTYFGNKLNGVDPVLAYCVFVAALCVFFGYWTWRFVGRLGSRNQWIRRIRGIAVGGVVLVLLLSSPTYVSVFIKEQGSVELPILSDASTRVTISLGRRAEYSTSLSAVKQNQDQVPGSFLRVGQQDLFKAYVDNNRLCIDTAIYAGRGKSPVVVRKSLLYGKAKRLACLRDDEGLRDSQRSRYPSIPACVRNALPYHDQWGVPRFRQCRRGR